MPLSIGIAWGAAFFNLQLTFRPFASWEISIYFNNLDLFWANVLNPAYLKGITIQTICFRLLNVFRMYSKHTKTYLQHTLQHTKRYFIVIKTIFIFLLTFECS
jgi:hypothetical protein